MFCSKADQEKKTTKTCVVQTKGNNATYFYFSLWLRLLCKEVPNFICMLSVYVHVAKWVRWANINIVLCMQWSPLWFISFMCARANKIKCVLTFFFKATANALIKYSNELKTKIHFRTQIQINGFVYKRISRQTLFLLSEW